MTEQCNGIVVCDGSGRVLPILTAYINSSAVYYAKMGFQYQRCYMKVGNADKSAWAGTVLGAFDVATGMFEFYVPGRYFSETCETAYRILAIDDYGHRTVCGEGKLRVGKVRISDINDAVRSNLVFFQEDGKWREVNIVTDSTGTPTYNVMQEPTEPPKGVLPGELYAFDTAKNKFFAISGYIDSVGVYALSVADTPSTSGKEDFIYDTATGFYRRAEALDDGVGGESLSIGDEIVG